MGCTSSTEAVTDPITGQEKIKKKLGGAYPGQRPPRHGQYAPPSGQNTAHFVQYGGGNALVLMDGASPQPQHGEARPEYISVTLPQGVSPGDTIHVQAPDGRKNAIIVPPGMYPGSTFTVQFETAPPPQQQQQEEHNKYYENPPVAPSAPVVGGYGGDYEPDIVVGGGGGQHSQQGQDDFVSGFGSNNRRY